MTATCSFIAGLYVLASAGETAAPPAPTRSERRVTPALMTPRSAALAAFRWCRRRRRWRRRRRRRRRSRFDGGGHRRSRRRHFAAAERVARRQAELPRLPNFVSDARAKAPFSVKREL